MLKVTIIIICYPLLSSFCVPGKVMNSFYNYLLNTYYEPGIVQEAVNKAALPPPPVFMELAC